MKLLLDTHAFIWWDSAPDLLPTLASNSLQASDTEVLLSLVSIWEIQIKLQLGKLTLRGNLADIIQQQQSENGIILLPIKVSHILALEELSQHHRDPFDRLLIAQSRVESAAIVSRDSIFKDYECQLIWEERR